MVVFVKPKSSLFKHLKDKNQTTQVKNSEKIFKLKGGIEPRIARIITNKNNWLKKISGGAKGNQIFPLLPRPSNCSKNCQNEKGNPGGKEGSKPAGSLPPFFTFP